MSEEEWLMRGDLTCGIEARVGPATSLLGASAQDTARTALRHEHRP